MLEARSQLFHAGGAVHDKHTQHPKFAIAWRRNNKCQDNELKDCPCLVAESTERQRCDDL